MVAEPLVSWEGIDQIEGALDALVEKARRLRQPKTARGREVLQVLSQEVFVNAFDYSTREVTYYNGDERELVLKRLSCVVYRVTGDGTYFELVRNGGGYYPKYPPAGFTFVTGGIAGVTRCFDFLWNYRKDVTQARYGRDGSVNSTGASLGLSSFVLGDIRSKRMLDFPCPAILKKGEGLVFSVSPTVCSDAASVTDQFSVAFIGYGYRRQPQLERKA